MKSPYFYIIQHIPSKKYYAGCKINSLADSSNLMTENGYQTTSKIVKNLIKKDGVFSFKILKIKHFENSGSALLYENKFLKKVDAANNSMFLNLHNGGKNFVNKGGYKLKKSTIQKMKKPKSKEAIKKQNQSKKNRSKDVYKKMVERMRKNIPVCISVKQNNKIKKFNEKYWDQKHKEEQKNRMLEYYKDNPVSQSTKDKLKIVSSGENNPMFGKKHSEETKQKMKLAWQKRKKNL